MWTDRDGESRAGLALQHHSFDSYGGHEMAQQHLTLSNVSKQHQSCPKFIDGKELNFLPQQQPNKCCGLTEMGSQELVWHCNITHWTHMEDMTFLS